MPPLRSNRIASLLLLSAALCPAVLVDGILVNRTIDDELGDNLTGAQVAYFPDGGWALGSICTTCNINPSIVDLSKAFDGTWHDTTHHPNATEQVITATFFGVAVYVFNIIANTVKFTTTLTNLSFTLDGELAGHYLHEPDSSTEILYNVSVFSQTGLTDGPHTIEISPTGPSSSLILFDYITYTVDEEAPSPQGVSSSSSSTASTAKPTAASSVTPNPVPSRAALPIGAIVGGAVGGAAGVVVVAAAVFFALRRRRRQPQGDTAAAGSAAPAGHGPPPHDASESVVERRMEPILAEPPPYYPGESSSAHPRGSPSAMMSASSPTIVSTRPISTTATVHSQRYTELNDRIRILEAQIGLGPSHSLGNLTSESSGVSRSTGSRSEGRRLLARELASLRTEIAEVRAILEHERELSTEMMMYRA